MLIGDTGDAFTFSDSVFGHSLLPKSFPGILIEFAEGDLAGV